MRDPHDKRKMAIEKVSEVKPAQREYPLRSKRREETRQALIKAAQKLMLSKGFNNVTMQEIADHAGTHAQTLYAHFPNKYALGSEATVDSLRSAIAARDTDTMTFWRSWVEQETREMMGDDTRAAFKSMVETRSEPRFATLLQAVAHEYIDILTHNLAADYALDPDIDLFPTLVAHMLWAANEHNTLAWQAADGNYDMVAGAVSAIDEVANIVNLVRAAEGVT